MCVYRHVLAAVHLWWSEDTLQCRHFVTVYASLAGRERLGILLSPPSISPIEALGLQLSLPMPSVGAGDHTQVLMIAQQGLYPLSISPAPLHSLAASFTE